MIEGLEIIIDNYIQDGTFYKHGNELICNSNTAYAFCFINGVTTESIEMAMSVARGVLKLK